MKKNLFYLLLLTCSISLFTACSSDDDDDVKLPIETDIAGTYKGDLSVVVDNAQMPSVPQRITITKSAKGNNQIALSIKDFKFASFNVGDIEVDPCQVKAISGGYSFEGQQTLVLAAPLGSCPVTINGTVKGDKVDIQIGVEVAALQQNVKANFAGTKLAGNESAEAKILTFAFDSELVTQQPVIDDASGTISFKVEDAATDDQLKLTPVFTISDKATVSPATGVVQDFSNGKVVTYTVVSENGATVKTYAVSIAGRTNTLKFSFEEWENVPGSLFSNEYDKPQPTAVLATSAEGASMLKVFQVTDVPVYKTDDKVNGNYAIKLVTLDTSAKANALVPAITSGSVFTGKFEINIEDRLSSTKFGVVYDRKPLSFKGWYKYTPGVKFIDGTDLDNIVEVPNRLDECAIQAVLYKVNDESETLTGHDINTSDNRVAVAVLKDGTAKNAYTSFDIPFTYLDGKQYEQGATYKLAIVCSSSKEGDLFKGAGGSTLFLDELEIIGE